MSDSPDGRDGADDASFDAHSSAEETASSADGDGPAEGDESTKADDPRSYESSGSGLHARDVEVPMRVYKTVTVFSTLIAVVFVVAGFVILDRATNRAQLPLSQVDPVLAVLGVAVMLFGAATYAFGTRFRAAGMGSSKNDDDESHDNG